LLVASDTETPQANPREHSDVRWFSFEDALAVITEDRMRPVYEKLFARVRTYHTNKRSS
jgi:8-oxo-dGTP pyrophosphatase MutT (NUDIX family)